MAALLTGTAMLLLAAGPTSHPLWFRMPVPQFEFPRPRPEFSQPPYPELTRQADWVGIGKVRTADGPVVFSVERALKGDAATDTVAFDPTPAVWLFSELLVDALDQPAFRPLGFAPGQRWTVFLRQQAKRPHPELLAAFREPQLPEKMVRAVLELDSLPDDESKCRMLVKLLAQGDLHHRCFAQELAEKHNRAEFLALLAPLAQTDAETYCRLVVRNPSPDATTLLARSLMRNRAYEREAERHLMMRCGNWADSADRVMRMVSHWRPVVRRVALRVLRKLRHPSAPALAERSLRDKDPSVRSVARNSPWQRHLREDPNLVPRFRELARDRYPEARQAGCSALAALPDRQSLYYLYGRALFDPNQSVRESIDLRPLWQHYPVGFALTMSWPALLVAAIALGVWRLFRLRRLLHAVVIGMGCAWLVAAGIAFAVRIGRPDFVLFAITVMPSATVPAGMVLSMVVYFLIRHVRSRAVSARL